MSLAVEDRNRRMLRARDTMDRAFARPLEVPALARIVHVSPAHFSRQFRETFGETPHRYLQRRRVERAMELLRETERSVSEICLDVGFSDPRASVATDSSFGEALRFDGVYRDAMLTRISHTFIYVLDQDAALDFYVGKLGMVVHTDADLGAMRWLTGPDRQSGALSRSPKSGRR
jgi:AraC-like DNA-binding protein